MLPVAKLLLKWFQSKFQLIKKYRPKCQQVT